MPAVTSAAAYPASPASAGSPEYPDGMPYDGSGDHNDHGDHDAFCSSSKIAWNPSFSRRPFAPPVPTPSPTVVPSPIPLDPNYSYHHDDMKRHSQAMVDRLNPKTQHPHRQYQPPQQHHHPHHPHHLQHPHLPPISSFTPRTPLPRIAPTLPQRTAPPARLSLSAHTSAMARRRSSTVSPRSIPMPTIPSHLSSRASPQQQPSVTSQSRILIPGMPAPRALNSRRSIGPGPRSSFSVASEGGRSAAPIMDRRAFLRAVGHMYLGDASTADIFVHAVAIRRPSPDRPATSRSPGEPTHATFRARVVPRAPERKPFLLQRNFDIDALRATIPDSGPTPMPSETCRASSVGSALLPPSSLDNRYAPLSQSLSPSRRTSRSDLLPSRAPRRSMLLDAKGIPRLNEGVPIHLDYARAFFPVLAALMASGHVKEGDVVDLPLPHPKAWSQTVAHVYSGKVELTQPVKDNILYLAGKVA